MDLIPLKAEGRYLTFSIAHEEFAVEVHRVREIIAPVILETVSDAAPHIRGVLRLRGKSVPVVDLRSRFGLEGEAPNRGSCVVTVLTRGWDGPFLVGLLVDGIREVIQVWAKDLEEGLAMEGAGRTGFLLGRAQCQDRTVLLLDVDKIPEGEESREASGWPACVNAGPE
jgi:purine-binding chemotaxis protein CheW